MDRELPSRARAPRRTLAVLGLLVLLGAGACGGLRGKANGLARKGRFVEAAEAYEGVVADDPGDPSLRAALLDLRRRALEQVLADARRARLEGQDEAAEVSLGQFLALRARWASKVDGGVVSSLEEEVAATLRHLRRRVGEPAQRGAALTAQAELVRKRELLAHPELSAVREELEATVQRSGDATCERLRQGPGPAGALALPAGAHWGELVARYCRHFGRAAPEAPVFPEALGAPAFDVAVQGMQGEVVGYLQDRLARAFEASPWYSARAPRPAPLALQGSFSESHARLPVELTAAWTDQEPYTAREEHTEYLEEPVSVEETYWEKGEKKTRTVTKTRRVPVTTTVEVTRYRDVPRTYAYRALRLEAAYRFALVTRAALTEHAAPLAVKGEDATTLAGYEHDVMFAPADVRPQRAQLVSGAAWLEQRLKGYEHGFAEQLLARWRQLYCEVPALGVEEAARCARAGLPLPEGSLAALAPHLADDAGRAHLLFARVGAPARVEPRPAPATATLRR